MARQAQAQQTVQKDTVASASFTVNKDNVLTGITLSSEVAEQLYEIDGEGNVLFEGFSSLKEQFESAGTGKYLWLRVSAVGFDELVQHLYTELNVITNPSEYFEIDEE
jgi:hypothetical protein